MRALIIEGEIAHVIRLKELLGEILSEETIFETVGTVRQSIDWLQNNPTPDLIFMNVDLGDGKCFEIFRAHTVICRVIFTAYTGEDAYMAIKYGALDYLLKPYTLEDVKRCVMKWQGVLISYQRPLSLLQWQTEGKYRDRFLGKIGKRLVPVMVADIVYFQSVSRMTYLHTRCERKVVLDFSLDEIEDMIDPLRFCRVSRTYILSKSIVTGVCQMSNRTLNIDLAIPLDQEIIVSRERSAQVTNWLGG